MPSIVNIPLVLLFYGFFWLIFANLLPLSLWLAPVFSGFIIGYITYDMTHYATHHFPHAARNLEGA